MPTSRYIALRRICEFHELEFRWVQEFIDHGLLEPESQGGEPCIPEEEIPRLETMLRLRVQLEINPAGIETIMHMRTHIQDLQARLRELEILLNRRS